MKTKRIVVTLSTLLLSVLLILPCSNVMGGSAEAAVTSSTFRKMIEKDPELKSAYELGLIPAAWEKDLKASVTHNEAVKLIGHVMSLKKGQLNKNTTTWMNKVSTSSNASSPILRKEYASYIFKSALENYYGVNKVSNNKIYDAFAYATTLKRYHNRSGEALSCMECKLANQGKSMDMDFFAVTYVTLQIDEYTRTTIMDVNDKGYLRINDKLTRKEAVVAAKRLYYAYFEKDYVSLASIEPIKLTADQMQKAKKMPEASYNHIPYWNGTALDNTTFAHSAHHTGSFYSEEDFSILNDLGFDFTRLFISHELLLDYSDNNNIKVSQTQLQNLDAAVGWAAENGVHICICLYDLPGFAGASFDIAGYTDPTLLVKATKVYQMLARRYKNIPNNLLSFNLFNEPWGLTLEDEDIYVKAVRTVLSAIREESPDRLVFVDGLDGSHIPVYSLVEDKVAQAFHMYDPDHFIYGSAGFGGFGNSRDAWYVNKIWPLPYANGWLRDPSMYLKLQGDFPKGMKVELLISNNGIKGNINLLADDAKVASISIKANESENGKVYSLGELKNKAPELTIQWDGVGGVPIDGVQIEGIALIYPEKSKTGIRYLGNDGTDKILYNKIVTIGCIPYGTDGNSTITIADDGTYTNPSQPKLTYDSSYIASRLEPWIEFSKKTGVGIMLQEWGVNEYHSKKSTLAYMKDTLSLLKENNFAWNLWSDSWQYLNTNRLDVNYESYRGYKLDRDMVTTLQKYMK